MRHALKFYFGVLVAVTTVLVCYVYQQVGILELSYQLKQKEELVSRLSDEYKNLEYQVASLQSPVRLEEKLSKSHLNLISPQNVIVIKRFNSSAPSLTFARNEQEKGSLLGWKHWIGFEREAHAKTPDGTED